MPTGGEIEIHLRRSLDGGKSWLPVQHIAHHGQRMEGNHEKTGGEAEQTVSHPVAIVDHHTGAIEFLYCLNYSRHAFPFVVRMMVKPGASLLRSLRPLSHFEIVILGR